MQKYHWTKTRLDQSVLLLAKYQDLFWTSKKGLEEDM